MDTDAIADLNPQRDGFNLGWDFFALGMGMPHDCPPEVASGYRAAAERHVPRKSNDRYARKWLQLRMNAFTRGRLVSENVTPQLLAELDTGYCPVTWVRLTYATGEGSDWSIDRVNNDGAYALGNLMVISTRANKAKGALSYPEIQARADGKVEDDALTQAEWTRLATCCAGVHELMQMDRGEPVVHRVLPCATWLPPHLPCSFAVAVQNMLLRGVPRLTDARDARWLAGLKQALDARGRELLKLFYVKLVRKLSRTAFAPSAFLNPGVWRAYLSWYEHVRATPDVREAVLRHWQALMGPTYERTQLVSEWSGQTNGYAMWGLQRRGARNARTAQLLAGADLPADVQVNEVFEALEACEADADSFEAPVPTAAAVSESTAAHAPGQMTS